MKNQLSYIEVSYPEPHLDRMKKQLIAHPEIKDLFGNTPSTAFYVVGIVALQIAAAIVLRDQAWWLILAVAYTLGATANHALWVLIHECTHNLVFKTTRANSWLAIVANFPIIFPSAMSFRIYHIKHHLHQGDVERDADLARPLEARLIGNSTLGKAFWLLFFFAWQMLRVPKLKSIEFMTRWVAVNIVIQFAFIAGLTALFGWKALLYIGLSSIFSIGLHPLGARWIQEHFVVHEKQETYSYYGPLNKVAFNVGYHNEHHDFMSVPWSRLPRVRAIAPEFYDTLYWHRSWTGLWIRFLTDPKLSLYSRVVRRRAQGKARKAAAVTAGLTQGKPEAAPAVVATT